MPVFHFPRPVIFENGSRYELARLIEELTPEGSRGNYMLVSTRDFGRNSEDELSRVFGEQPAVHITGIPADPPLETVENLRKEAVSANVEVIIAIGGGSVIDTGKAAAVLANKEGALEDFFYGRQAIEHPGLPFIAAPTTAGSGAEMTRNAVLTDPRYNTKQSLRSNHMFPDAAVVDPELTLNLPPPQTASSGLDALTQAMESYMSSKANAVTQALAREAVAHLYNHLPAAWRDGNDQTARTQVAMGSMLTGMAFSQSGLGAVHGLAHPIGALLNIPHGTVCAILLPQIMHWNLSVCEQQFQELAIAIGAYSPESVVEEIRQLCHTLQKPKTLRDFGFKRDHFEHVLQNCRSGSMKANPRQFSDAELQEILEGLL